MPYEPAWSKQISSSTVCTWFYALALVNLFFGTAGVLGSIYLLSKGKSSMASLAITVLAASVGFMNSWFFFLICSRGLHTEGFGILGSVVMGVGKGLLGKRMADKRADNFRETSRNSQPSGPPMKQAEFDKMLARGY